MFIDLDVTHGTEGRHWDGWCVALPRVGDRVTRPKSSDWKHVTGVYTDFSGDAEPWLQTIRVTVSLNAANRATPEPSGGAGITFIDLQDFG